MARKQKLRAVVDGLRLLHTSAWSCRAPAGLVAATNQTSLLQLPLLAQQDAARVPQCSSWGSIAHHQQPPLGSGCSRGYGFAAAAAVNDPQPQFCHSVAQPSSSTDLYQVRIVTGNLRGAGTQSSAQIQLIGSHGVSQRYTVGDDDTGGPFERGSSRCVLLPVPKGFGTLRRVHIEKHRSNQAAGDGWFLKRVEVDHPSGSQVVFPCNAWLGESDCGGHSGPIERDLLPAVLDLAVDQPSPVRIHASGVAIPHPEKVLKAKMKGHNIRGFGYGGEDAYFFSHAGGGALFGMGVADGVYMWRDQGIDSGLMSRRLMEACSASIASGTEDVFKVLKAGVGAVQSEHLQGSATVCVLTINQHTGQLQSANLGDSGFLVFGTGKSGEYELKFRTNQLEHSFGCPYQIGHHATANKVEDSDLASFHVRPGDVIVMGSDGLLDNVSDLEMQATVQAMWKQGASPSAISQRLTKMAFDASMDKRRVTPYSKGASEAFDMVYSGGKPDDITVLVAVCGAASAAPS